MPMAFKAQKIGSYNRAVGFLTAQLEKVTAQSENRLRGRKNDCAIRNPSTLEKIGTIIRQIAPELQLLHKQNYVVLLKRTQECERTSCHLASPNPLYIIYFIIRINSSFLLFSTFLFFLYFFFLFLGKSLKVSGEMC